MTSIQNSHSCSSLFYKGLAGFTLVATITVVALAIIGLTASTDGPFNAIVQFGQTAHYTFLGAAGLAFILDAIWLAILCRKDKKPEDSKVQNAPSSSSSASNVPAENPPKVSHVTPEKAAFPQLSPIVPSTPISTVRNSGGKSRFSLNPRLSVIPLTPPDIAAILDGEVGPQPFLTPKPQGSPAKASPGRRRAQSTILSRHVSTRRKQLMTPRPLPLIASPNATDMTVELEAAYLESEGFSHAPVKPYVFGQESWTDHLATHKLSLDDLPDYVFPTVEEVCASLKNKRLLQIEIKNITYLAMPQGLTPNILAEIESQIDDSKLKALFKDILEMKVLEENPLGQSDWIMFFEVSFTMDLGYKNKKRRANTYLKHDFDSCIPAYPIKRYKYFLISEENNCRVINFKEVNENQK